MRKKLQKQGFTLIELMVVITIIAILASISVPVYNTVTERAKITKDLSNAKQIVLVSRIYASDNEGLFPGRGSANSTAAFNDLIPEYCSVEDIFFTGQVGKTIPDGDGTLLAAENCYSFVDGLTNSTPGDLPLVADWFTAGGATYDANHVWWSSGKAVVGRVDGSAKAEKLIGGEIQEDGINIFAGLTILDP